MKIAITTYSLSYGGVGNFILDLAQFLMKQSHEIEIICTDSPGAWFPRIEEIGAKSKKYNNIFYGWIPLGRFIHAFIVGRYIQRKNFDLIINNGSFAVHTSCFLFRPKAKFITVIHNQLPQIVEAESISLSDTIICVSPKIYKQALKYVEGNKIVTILNGAKFQEYYKRVNFHDHARHLKLLYVGRMDNHQKAIFILPEIIKELVKRKMDILLTIVGSGPDLSRFKELVSNEDCKDRIKIVGLVNADKVISYYQESDVFLLPSNFEGLPLTLIEAMGNGCVPVASLLPDSTDLCVQHGINGFLIQPGKVNEFADSIERVYNDGALLKKMSFLSIQIANEKFNLQHVHNRYLQEINELMNNSNVSFKKSKYLNQIKICKEIVPYLLKKNLKAIINK